MTVHISERIPATVLRRSETTGTIQPQLELSAERFMGVLKHPVVRSEMLEKFGIDRRGCKVVVSWCPDATKNSLVEAGDLLETGDEIHRVLGTKSHPNCYLEIYMEEASESRS
jgi:hypothetical protein